MRYASWLATGPMIRRSARDRNQEKEVVEDRAPELAEEALAVDAAVVAGSIDHTR